jgi:tetratricopeptide (TPR) repeat protein
MPHTIKSSAQPSSRPARLGERVRQLRVAAGLTQTELAGERFSKEYVSQIERGKTRPTQETIEWLAGRLRVDASFLASGVSADERARVEAVLTRAEALTEAHKYDEAVEHYGDVKTAMLATGSPELRVRALNGEGWARMQRGEVRDAIELFDEARRITEGDSFSDLDRADVMFRLGVCRYKLSSISTSVALLSEALTLAERSGLPCDLLRSNVLAWRSRCYRRQRDWEAAREDVEHALELAEGLGDKWAVGDVYFQASLIAERNGHWVLARTYAERAKRQFEEIADQANVGRLMANLGGLNFLLGKPEEAKRYLKDAFAIALEGGQERDAAQVVSSLAQVHLRTGEIEVAEQQARHALSLLEGSEDEFMLEVGNAQLVLGRSLLEQARLDEAEEVFKQAEATFEQASSASHRAAVWVAQGDLAQQRSDDRTAARLYRRAAETLQDFRF